jgi:hypothetical protein
MSWLDFSGQWSPTVDDRKLKSQVSSRFDFRSWSCEIVMIPITFCGQIRQQCNQNATNLAMASKRESNYHTIPSVPSSLLPKNKKSINSPLNSKGKANHTMPCRISRI